MHIKGWWLLILLLLGGGCQPDRDSAAPDGGSRSSPATANGPTESPDVLQVVVVDDPPLARILRRQVAPILAYDLEVQELGSRDLESQLDQLARADCLIVPAQWLGTLAQQHIIAPVPASVIQRPELEWDDVLPMYRQQETRWAGDLYALPLGSAHFNLLYRLDVLEQQKRQVPQTWAELDQAVAALQSAQQVEQGVVLVEPLATGWAGKMLLARAAAYARERSRYSTLFDYRTMEPLIAQAPFVRALEELAQAHRGHAEQAMQWTPEICRQMVFSGDCVLAVTWPAAPAEPDSTVDGGVQVGVAPLPGSGQVYSDRTASWGERRANDRRVLLLSVAGRLVCVGRSSSWPQSAWDLAVTLCGSKLSGDVSPKSNATAPLRRSHLSRVAAWLPPGPNTALAQQYGQTLEAMQRYESVLHAVRIPGFLSYEEALDAAVHQALLGTATPTEALQQAAQTWNEITTSIGTADQVQAYQSSLGLDLDSSAAASRKPIR